MVSANHASSNSALIGEYNDRHFRRACNIRQLPNMVKIANTIFVMPRTVYSTVLVDTSRHWGNSMRQTSLAADDG